MTPVAMHIERLSKRYGGTQALDDVTLDIKAGSVLALLGENGAGKSTLIALCSGATSPTGGKILVNGKEANFTNPKNAVDAGVTVVHQEPKLGNEASIAENIYLASYGERPFWALNEPRRLIERAGAHLNELGLEGGLPDVATKAGQLSAAQRQLVAIAKAMTVENVKVLFLDEPNSSLTPKETNQLWELVRRVRDRGVAVVVVSHRLKELYEVVDQIAVLRDGRLIGAGTAAEIPITKAIVMMAGRNVADTHPREPHGYVAESDVALELRGVHSRAIHGIDLELRSGEILGLAGLVGSGRTELGRLMVGADKLLSGSILLEGEVTRFRSPRDALAKGVVMTCDERRLAVFLSQDVKFNIGISVAPSLAKGGWITPATFRAVARHWIEKLRLRGNSESQVASLSGGNQQKALISRVLACPPTVIIFDEPTHGIDVGTKAEISQLIRGLADEGKAIMFISSEVEELVGVADRVAVMRNGQLVQQVSGADGLSLVAAALGEVPVQIPERPSGEQEGKADGN